MSLRWNRYSIYGLLFVLPTFAYFLLVFFYPLFLAFWDSLRNVDILAQTSVWVGLGKYIKVFRSSGFQRAIPITFSYVLIILPPIMLLALIMSNLISNTRREWSGRVLSTIFFLPVICSMVSAGMIWDWIMDPTLGLINNVLGAIGVHHHLEWLRSPSSALYSVVIIAVWNRIGVDIVILLTGLQNIPRTYYEAAEIDGASPIRKYIHITLPMLNPQIVMVLTYELIYAFKAFDQIYVTTQGGPAGSTTTIMVYLLKHVFAQDFGAALAITVIMLLFLVTISILQNRFLRRVVEY